MYGSNKCEHKRLYGISGGWGINCADCGRQWTCTDTLQDGAVFNLPYLILGISGYREILWRILKT